MRACVRVCVCVCACVCVCVCSFSFCSKHIVKRANNSEAEGVLRAMGVSSPEGKRLGQLSKALKGVGLPCGLCGASQSDVTLMPCQHKCVCGACSSKVSRCPLCGEEVKDKVITDPGNRSLCVLFLH